MEKVIFTDPDTKEKIEFYVLEETQINGKKFLFVTEEEDGDSEAYILKEIADENDDVVYEMVEDDNELAALGKVFAELIDDADIEYEICLESNPEEEKCLLVVNGKEYRSKDTADSKISIEGSIKEWNVKMKIINQTGKKLPDTGSAGKPVLLTGILAVGIMAMIYRKKEQKR